MKKLLAIVVLGLLTACSMEQSTKTLTNCADNWYSKKNRKSLPENFVGLITLKAVPQNELEKQINTLAQAGFKPTEIMDWFNDLLKTEGPTSKYLNYKKESILLAKKISKDSDKKVKKFIATNLNKKLKNKKYEKYFEACEYERKNTPKTFDAKWAKPKVVLNNIK